MDIRRRHTIETLAGLGMAIGVPTSSPLAFAGTPELSAVQQRAVSVLDFGAKGNGVGDDTRAVQAAIDAAAMVFFPPGTYRLSGVTIRKSGKYLFGAYKRTVFWPIGSKDLIRVLGSDVRIRDLTFTHPGGPRTGGAYVSTIGSFVHIQNCYFDNGYRGIVSDSTLFTLSDCDFRNFAPTVGICVQINGGFNVNLDRIRSDHPVNAMPLAGINIVSTGDTTITNSNLIHCGSSLLVNPGERQVVASLRASNTFFDSADEGIALVPEKGAIVRSHFLNCWSSSNRKCGTRIDGASGLIDGLTFIDHQSNVNGGDGVAIIGSNSRNVYVLGGEMAENSGPGLSIGQGIARFYLHNIQAGAVHGLKGNDVGIHVASGCSDYEVVDCVCESNRSAQIIDESKNGRIRGNVGFITRASGAAFIPISELSVHVKHSLAATPVASDISITPTSSSGANPIYLDATSVTPVEFVVRCIAPAVEKMPFVWQASCLGG